MGKAKIPAEPKVGNQRFDDAIADIIGNAMKMDGYADGQASWAELLRISTDIWSRCQDIQKHIREAETAIATQMRAHRADALAEAKGQHRDEEQKEVDAERARLDAEDDARITSWSREKQLKQQIAREEESARKRAGALRESVVS